MTPHPRHTALNLVELCLREGHNFESACEKSGRFRALSSGDKTFAVRLAQATIEHVLEIDRMLSRLVTKPLPPKHAVVQDILRLGVAQIVFANIPVYAAVSTSVELCEMVRRDHMKGLVNAVLRRVAKEFEMKEAA